MKLSVIMPTYNHETTIAQAIESYLMQKHEFESELIISDDASTDSTLSIARRYAETNPDIRIISKSSNEGLICNYRTLLEAATGEYVAILESDDCWTDAQKSEMQVSFLDSNPDFNLSFTRVAIIKRRDVEITPDFKQLVEERDNRLYEYMLLRSIIHSPSVIFRRNAFDKYCDINHYVNEKFVTFDYPVWMSLAANGKVHYLSSVCAAYRVSASSLSNTESLKKRLSFERGINQIRSYVVSLYGTGDISLLKVKMREVLIYSRIVWRNMFK